MERRKIRNYDLYRGHAYYVPGVGGMFALFGWFLMGGLLGGAVTAILTYFLGAEFTTTYGMLIVYPLQFMPAMMYAAFQSRKNALFDKGYALDSKHFGRFGFALCAVLVVLGTLAVAFVGDIVNYGNYLLTERSPFLAKMYDLVQDQMKQLTGGPIWLSLLTTAVLAPVFEEWLCRGMVLRGLLQKKSPATAIVLSALFFALLHLNPWQALNAFIIGCLLGYVYYRTGSLWLTMLMHATNNALAVVMSHIDSLEDVEYFIDVMSPGAYAAVMAVSIAVLSGVVVLFRRIPLERPQGNCDEVVEELPESVA